MTKLAVLAAWLLLSPLANPSVPPTAQATDIDAGPTTNGPTVSGLTVSQPSNPSAPIIKTEPPPPNIVPRYFVLVFGSESVPKRPRYTHTWATIVRVTAEEAAPQPAAPSNVTRHEGMKVDALTISWMPATLNIRPLAPRAECGVNLSLEASLQDAFCKGQRVALWGPYEVVPERGPLFYEMAARQIARLKSGCVLYKCIDPNHGRRKYFISNCIHAVTDLDRYQSRPFYNELLINGLDASEFLVGVLAKRHRINPQVNHDWVLEAMKLDMQCIERHQAPRCLP